MCQDRGSVVAWKFLSRSRLQRFVQRWGGAIVVLAAVLITSGARAAGDSLALLVAEQEKLGWNFDDGREFPGAKGQLSLDNDEHGKPALRLQGDFTGGGAYVQMSRTFKDGLDLDVLRFRIRGANAGKIGMRLVDASGQCHQIALRLKDTDDWQLVHFPVTEFFAKRGSPAAIPGVAKYEFWGGAKDGKWHDPASMISLLLTVNSDKTGSKQPVLWLSDIQAQVTQEALAQPASFASDFEKLSAGASVPEGWQAAGRVVVGDASEQPFKGQRALRLDRPFADIEKPCHVITAPFVVKPGSWQIDAAARSDLRSPDSSFRGVLALELLDAADKVTDTVTLIDLFGQRNWTPVSKRVDIPAQVARARFKAELHKAEGRFWIDELSASFLAATPRRDNRISRVVLSSDRVGNLFFPEDPRRTHVTLDALKPLAPEQMNFRWSVHSYWGAELAPPATATFTTGLRKQNAFEYTATLDLSALPLEVGPYYEVHVEVPQLNHPVAFHNYTSLAILPQALTKQYKPEQVPFTTRSWDNRIGVYMELSDRLGIRVAGVWGSWNAEPPYTPRAPTIEVAQKLGMGVLTGTPAHQIEILAPGHEKFDETAMRQGVRNWIARFGHVRPLYVNLGNEPHGTGERVIKQVRAYKAIYDEIKSIDPTITVIATSVPPTEEYFQAGYQNACDAYDFHVYESPLNVRRTIEAYREMARRYNADKPIWSTEIGLNSQGLARHAVAVDLIRKVTTFFAAGGANVSWFGIMYPDPQAKIFDDSSSAHNVFDCRYNKYAPKLDAIAYYNMVNAIAIKKFIAEKTYDNTVHATLFRDEAGQCLKVLWTDKGRVDTSVPLGGAIKPGDEVQLVHVEGRRSKLVADARGAITLSVREDPVLLLYQGGPSATLPEQMGKPAVQIAALPESFVRGEKAQVTLTTALESMTLIAPLGWDVQRSGTQGSVTFSITPAVTSKVREGELVIRAGPSAELVARAPVAGPVSVQILPTITDSPTQVLMRVTNNSTEVQRVNWKLSLLHQRLLREGVFSEPASATAFFAGPAEGSLAVQPREVAQVRVPLSSVDPLALYRLSAAVTDTSGRLVEHERFMGGFAVAPRVQGELVIDGNLDKPQWQRAPAARIDRAEQRREIARGKMPAWGGTDDLSATIRYLWNEQYLFLAVRVRDNVHHNKAIDGDLWNGDGVQLLVDPCRALRQKAGKYDLGFALTRNGPQSWCFLSGSSGIPTGPMPEVRFATSTREGEVCYEIAIPWKHLSPFVPEPGANLGLTIAVNEDDGTGRFGFLNWFGDVQTKSVDSVGDVILQP